MSRNRNFYKPACGAMTMASDTYDTQRPEMFFEEADKEPSVFAGNWSAAGPWGSRCTTVTGCTLSMAHA